MFKFNPFTGNFDLAAGSAPLSAVLAVGNVSGANDIQMTVGQVYASASGGSELNLNPFGDNSIVLATDGLSYGETGIEMYPDFVGIWGAAYSQFLAFNNTGGSKSIELRNGIVGEDLELSAKPVGGITVGDLIIFDNSAAAKTTDSTDKYPVSISTENTTFVAGIVNSAAIGTIGAKVLSDNTAYVDRLGFYHLDGVTDREGILTNTALTGSHTWALPDKGGTVAMTSDIVGSAGVDNRLQFADGSGGFKDSGYQHIVSSLALGPLTNGGRNLGSNGLRFGTVHGFRHDALTGDTNGYNFSGSGASAQITAKAGSGDGITLWANSTGTGRRMNVGTSGIAISNLNLLTTDQATSGVALDILGNSILRFRGAAAATISGVTGEEGMMSRATTTDATFTETGIWGYEGGSWEKVAFKSDLDSGQTYTITNGVIDRSIDLSTFTLDELGDVVFAIYTDLASIGILN